MRSIRRRAARSTPAEDLERAELTVVALRAGQGDRAAEQVFVQRTMADVWRFCAHLIGPEQADDATQSTYLRALRSLPSFRGDSSAKTWLLGVARHVCIDELRASGRRDRVGTRLAAQPTDHLTSGGSLPPELTDLIESLDPDRREAFVLTQVLGFSYQDAAAVCGCPVGTVRSRVARARDVLLADLADDEPRTSHA